MPGLVAFRAELDRRFPIMQGTVGRMAAGADATSWWQLPLLDSENEPGAPVIEAYALVQFYDDVAPQLTTAAAARAAAAAMKGETDAYGPAVTTVSPPSPRYMALTAGTLDVDLVRIEAGVVRKPVVVVPVVAGGVFPRPLEREQRAANLRYVRFPSVAVPSDRPIVTIVRDIV
jgi:hypothetical protein